ncbi:hypothetical protein PUN28_003514 [Cardiocondyla obscurior]|uniref:Nuclear transcription factor Y subunit n=1 Tax=Cardiocondyla obscurior TaxID=286306 RepID=A0AAW2GNA7_9HYME
MGGSSSNVFTRGDSSGTGVSTGTSPAHILGGLRLRQNLHMSWEDRRICLGPISNVLFHPLARENSRESDVKIPREILNRNKIARCKIYAQGNKRHEKQRVHAHRMRHTRNRHARARVEKRINIRGRP